MRGERGRNELKVDNDYDLLKETDSSHFPIISKDNCKSFSFRLPSSFVILVLV